MQVQSIVRRLGTEASYSWSSPRGVLYSAEFTEHVTPTPSPQPMIFFLFKSLGGIFQNPNPGIRREILKENVPDLGNTISLFI